MKRRELLAGAGVLALAGFSKTADAGGFDAREEEFPQEYADIVIVGGGAAGLSAAVSAAETARKLGRRLRIVLFEKNAEIGGDTLLAGGYFNAVDPGRQAAMHIADSTELFEKQMLEAAGGGCSPELVHRLAVDASEALDWLESYGVIFVPRVYQVFGSLYPRAHKPVLPAGRGYVQALAKAAIAAHVSIRTSSRVESLIKEGSAVRGVVYEKDGVRNVCRSSGVVIASGGFGANRRLVKTYAPALAELAVDTQPGSTGDLHLAAQAAGAELINMSFIECIPGAGVDVAYPLRLDYIPERMIFVDDKGSRFVEESSTRQQIASAILARRPSKVWAVADQSLVSDLDARFQKNIYRGLYAAAAWRESTIERLAARMGIDVEGLRRTVSMPPADERIRSAPFWAVEVHLRVHATLGGIRISESARALDSSGQGIPGLWAAGAVTGGVHGRNRIGGNGINTAVVFGRIAGREAARAAINPEP